MLINDLPDFDVKPELVVSEMEAILKQARAVLAEATKGSSPTWESLIVPIDEMQHRIATFWSPIRHMNAVMKTKELEDAHNKAKNLLTVYHTELGQHEGLYALFLALERSPEFTAYSPARKKVIENAIRNAKLSGVGLPAEQKTRFAAIAERLSALSDKFEENVGKAMEWKKHVTDPKVVTGIPEDVLEGAKEKAKALGKEGWIFGLDGATHSSILGFADNAKLREEFYLAWVTRASDRGPTAHQFDNGKLMEETLALRHEEARMLGFKNYAELSVETKMAPDGASVMRFLVDLNARAHNAAHKDSEALKAFAREKFGVTHLDPWDYGYYSEKLREEKYAISKKELKKYFPLERVLSGMFKVIERLYGVHAKERKDVKTWHKDVRFFELYDRTGGLRGQFYLDPYARPGQKRGGAWMDECVSRMKTKEGALHVPVAFLSCNSTAPSGDKQGLLDHNDVTTVFHEFGHGLHHMLTLVDELDISGINGVEWDAVEFPSQFMENFCWEWDALQEMTAHVDTGLPLPREMYEKMIAAKNYHSAMGFVRQMEFSIFDFRLHREYDPAKGARIFEILDEVRKDVRVVPTMIYDRGPSSFTHIFSGGYAAGYFSYKWAEVLSADAYSLFEEKGVSSREAGELLLREVLQVGGSRPMAESFKAFRGRDPDPTALLRHNGLLET